MAFRKFHAGRQPHIPFDENILHKFVTRKRKQLSSRRIDDVSTFAHEKPRDAEPAQAPRSLARDASRSGR
jgi:hypothetical protein